MRVRVAVGVAAVAVLSVSVTGQQAGHLNPMIELLMAKKPIFGVGVPTPPRVGGGG